ncbi:thiamine-phosphate kinase [Salisaeta longa]|uniref:thiamine-phosphate kinase n=1 Tax=Salisaeta longa TaxID=503170 RepID=UPI0003B43924|nr:thiamine-phosphate kinase [Salisaeta longa]
MDADAQPQHTPISDVGEFGLIAHLRDTLGPPDANDEALVMGISDDAAVYRVGDGQVHVVTTDTLLEGIHFDRSFVPLEHLGFKALSANVSDVVAMNARPRYATISLGIPEHVSVEMMRTLYEGVHQACEAYDMRVIGGDTTGAHGLSLTVTVIGAAAEEDIVYRGGAQVGDKLCVTGDLGASYAGLKVLLEQRKQLQDAGDDFQPDLEGHDYVIRRHLAPPAQLQTIKHWAEAGVQPHALIDISDGLASEVHHICQSSETGAQLYAPALPLHPGTRNAATLFGEDVDTYALFGGEDYELLFALPEDDLQALDATTYTVIGDVTPPDDGVQIQQPTGENIGLQPGGFDHFDAPDDA